MKAAEARIIEYRTRADAICARIMGMQVANDLRRLANESPVYGDGDFGEAEDELNILADSIRKVSDEL